MINFTELVNMVILENVTCAAFGTPAVIATQFSGDTYATGDARTPKVLGGVMRRGKPENIFLGTTVKKKRKKTKKHKRS